MQGTPLGPGAEAECDSLMTSSISVRLGSLRLNSVEGLSDESFVGFELLFPHWIVQGVMEEVIDFICGGHETATALIPK